MNDYHLLQAAKAASLEANYNGNTNVQIGCVVTYKGTILAKGQNSDKTHSVQNNFNKYRYKDVGNTYLPAKCHAEIAALVKIKYLNIDFSKVRVYTYRQYKDGSPALARPCPACLAYIRSLGIDKIIYTTGAGYAKETLRKV